jgi:DNA-binding MarR family transcriptional regulator
MAEHCLCFRSRRVARGLTRMYEEALRPLGLEPTQLTLLNVVALSGPGGGAMGLMADFLALDPTTLSRNLRPLERAGLVRMAQGTDRRIRLARITPAGRRMIARALPRWRAAHARVVAALGGEGADLLRTRLDATAAALPPAGLPAGRFNGTL